MSLDHAEVADCSFLRFVYPFTFQPETFEERVRVLDERKSGDTALWLSQAFPQDDLMPHVAAYLNPKAAAQPPGERGDAMPPATARLWGLNDHLDQAFGLGRRADWSLLAKRDHAIPFCLGDRENGRNAVQLVLFRVGVGMLTVQASPKGTRLAEWLDFLHYFRVSDGQRQVRVQGARRIGRDQSAPFFPEPAGGVAAHPDGTGVLRDLLEALLRTGGVGADGGDWWGEIFVPGKLLPFAALYVDGLGGEAEAAKLRYQLRHFFRAGQQVIPCTSDLCDDHSSLLPYADRQWFVFSIEGGAFLSCDAPDGFFRETMPDHLRKDYFLLFLLALHQRFALVSMSAQVARHWPLGGEQSERGREEAFTRIRDTLLAFTARGYFAQVMQRDNHHRVYRKWQEVFQLDRLYEEVRDEVREMHEYLRMKQTERTQSLIARFGIVIGLTSATFGFLGINIAGLNVPTLPLRTAWRVAAMLVLISAVALVPLLPRPRARGDGQRRADPRRGGRVRAPRPDPAPPLPPPPVAVQAVRTAVPGVKADDGEEAQVARLQAGGE